MERQRAAELSNQSYAHANSVRLLAERKRQRYPALFSQLDTDGDGVIDPKEAAKTAAEVLGAGLAGELVPILQRCPPEERLTLATFAERIEEALVCVRPPPPHLPPPLEICLFV